MLEAEALKPVSESQSERFLCRAVALGTLISLTISYPLWTSDRLYAVVPISGFLENLSRASAALPFFTLAALLVVLLFGGPRRSVLTLYLVFALSWGLLDQNRFQPWFFHSLLFIFALAASKGRLELCRLIVAGTYFWSGVQKINFSFVSELFPWLVSPFINIFTQASWIAPLAIALPFVELGFGLLLLIPATRRVAAVGIILMHLGILACIGPFGHNWNEVVWPWNLEMGAVCYILFLVPRRRIQIERELIPRTVPGLLVALFAVLLPGLNLVGLWDSYLSFALYSGNTIQASLIVDPENASELPKWLVELGMVTGEQGLEIDYRDWALAEVGVPGYPAERVVKAVGASMCRRVRNQSAIRISLAYPPDIRSGVRIKHSYSCADLN